MVIWMRKESWRKVRIVLRIAHPLCWPKLCYMLSPESLSQKTSQYFMLSYPGDFKLLIIPTFSEPSRVPMIVWSSQGKWLPLSNSSTSMWLRRHWKNYCLMNKWHAADREDCLPIMEFSLVHMERHTLLSPGRSLIEATFHAWRL